MADESGSRPRRATAGKRPAVRAAAMESASDDDWAPARQRPRRVSGAAAKGKGKAKAKAYRAPSAPRSSARTTPDRDFDGDSDDDDGSEGERKAAAAAARRSLDHVPAFREPGAPSLDLDDEVERVLAHRIAPGEVEDPADPWLHAEFRIKWRRWSYLHTTWEERDTLAQLPGFKRVLNYVKRVDEYRAARPHMSREAAEYADVQLAMEEEEAQEHEEVERVIKCVPDPSKGGELAYLVKWRNLPYQQATWEAAPDAAAAKNGAASIADFDARMARLRERTVTVDAARHALAAKGARALQVQPAFLQRGPLRDYQLQGLNWLVYSWSKNENCILADEVGGEGKKRHVRAAANPFPPTPCPSSPPSDGPGQNRAVRLHAGLPARRAQRRGAVPHRRPALDRAQLDPGTAKMAPLGQLGRLRGRHQVARGHPPL
jgi:chromodomain-helicase-DNA-binding protein 1